MKWILLAVSVAACANTNWERDATSREAMGKDLGLCKQDMEATFTLRPFEFNEQARHIERCMVAKGYRDAS